MEKDMVEGLRHRIHRFEKNLELEDALFLADHLLSLTDEPDDAVVYCKLLFMNRKFHECIDEIERRGLHTIDFDVFQLLAKSRMELEQWDAALNVLGEDSTKDYSLLTETDSEEQKDEKLSSIFYLRGVVFEKNENFSMASNWYIQSLTKDRFRVSAFRALQRMRSFRGEDEESLIQNRLGFDEKIDFERLIRGLYGTWGSASTQVKRRYMDSLMKWEPWKEMLAKNRHLQAAQAEIMFDLFDMERARTITQRLVASYPHFERGVLIHAATLVECGGMDARCELFSLAQHWIDSFPNKAISFFIVGSYYYLIKKFDHSRKFFARSLEIDRQYAPSLLGLAHACSAEDEYDQAMASYRIACRIFPGAHVPRVSIAMEHITSGNYSLALAELEEASTLCPDDPSVCHERGVVEFKLGHYEASLEHLEKAYALVGFPSIVNRVSEPIVFNLAHCYRKLGRYEDALSLYRMCLSSGPHNASIYAAIGFTYHLMGGVDLAITNYHKALGLKSSLSFIAELLKEALKESSSQSFE